MALPVVQKTPEFTVTLPSSGQEVKMRPYLVGEEKILYMALESQDKNTIVTGLNQVIKNCMITEGIKVEQLPFFDFEYLFVQLRARSSGETINLEFETPECLSENVDPGQREAECPTIKTSINIDQLNVDIPEQYNKQGTVMITEDIGIKLAVPSIKQMPDEQLKASTFEQMFTMIAGCIVQMFDSETVYQDFTKQEAISWLETLSPEQFAKINEFFNTLPRLRHQIEDKCSICGQTRKQTIEGMQSFFM